MTKTVRRSDDRDVAVLEIDHPDRSMNVVDEQVLVDVATQLDAALADDAVGAIVLASGKTDSFGAGADVAWLPELAAREDAATFLSGVHALMLRMVRAPKPIVAAINGPAFGGALELALGAREIVAAEGATMGLPEVTLGLLPGGGGTQLLTRAVGVEDALELLVTGARLTADEAQRRGLVAEVVTADELRARAVQRARQATGPGGQALASDEHVAAGSDPRVDDLVSVQRDTLAASRSGLSRAAEMILDVVRTGATEGLEAGLRAEREGFLALLRSPEARAAIHLFRVEADVRRRSRGAGAPVEALGVVGGGQMGAGIAAAAATRGLHATVRDLAPASLERARDYLDKVLSRRPPADGDDPVARWSGTTAWDGFSDVDAVVEAVFELPELKTSVLAELGEQVGDDTLLATNTSAISIASLAGAVPRPERFLGMHFFSPVERMPLVELIPHAGTAPGATARAAALGRRLGKVPVVVGDAPGFFTSRVYARWLMEGVRLLLDGVGVADVDAAAKRVGFPVGPLQAHDEATLELVVQASITQVAEPVMADRLDVAAVRRALETLLAADVRGRRHGRGFYAYDDGRRVGANTDVHELLGVTPAPEGSVDPERTSQRLLLAFATECWLCWDDGTLCHPDDGDVAGVLGIGFPRVLGGPFHWADELGPAEILARCETLGPAFPAGDTVRRHATTDRSFSAEARRPAPYTEPEGAS